MARRLAIQGFQGSFHEAAAQLYWGNSIEVITCSTFGEVISTAEHNENCDGAVMAIENSIAGSILPNYNLLKQSNLKITGEVYLEVKQQLLVNPGVSIDQVQEVHSHPMAILQCLDFLDQYPHWKIVESEDTALSAKRIYQSQSRTIATIASSLAAEMFNLKILHPDIHTMKQNYTRFLVLEKPDKINVIANADKASVYFHIANKKGSLAHVLKILANEEVNLRKLQSFPIPGSNWLYSFHADIEFDTMSQFEKTITEVEKITDKLNIYGVYKRGN